MGIEIVEKEERSDQSGLYAALKDDIPRDLGYPATMTSPAAVSSSISGFTKPLQGAMFYKFRAIILNLTETIDEDMVRMNSSSSVPQECVESGVSKTKEI